jgi:uncharacterized protein (TIGR00725 family)
MARLGEVNGPYVAVVGASQAAAPALEAAEEVGERLAQAGAIVICGGRGGVMEAVCRGAKRGGGTTVGILPGERRDEANPWVDLAIATGLGEARNAIVARCADGLVAIGGEFGTLSEIALGLRAGKPVVGLDTWTLARDGADDPIVRAADPASAVRVLLELLARTDR